jgi:hypothetical protein
MKNKYIVIIGCALIVLLSIIYLSSNGDDNAKRIQQAWNEQPGNHEKMSLEKAKELSNRLNNLDNGKQIQSDSNNGIKESNFIIEWQNKYSEIVSLLSKIETERNVFLSKMEQTDESNYYNMNMMLERINKQKNEGKTPQIALLNVVTDLLNDILARINVWKKNHSDNIPNAAKEPVQKIMALQESIKNL